MFECKICGKKCNRKISFKAHLSQKHKMQYIDYIKKYNINEKNNLKKEILFVKFVKNDFF